MEINRLKAELMKVPDPRRQYGNLRHKLEEILIIGLCSVICCGEDFDDMEDFGKDREEWLRGFLELPNGIPCNDTFRRVFERLNPQAVAKSLNAWLCKAGESGGRSVSLDGKTICGSGNAKHSAYHMVSAWVSETQITLGELAVPEKSNEITAIPALLDLIDVDGDIVTIDAMGCQTEIAAKIREVGADYVLSLKDNQPTLHEDVSDYFDWIENEQPKSEAIERFKSRPENDHGRIETREILTAPADWIEKKEDWADIHTVIRYRCTREIDGVKSVSVRHYISSFDTSAEGFLELIRGHWSVENQLHWMLDVVFREDSARARKDHSPLNCNVLRKIALAVLRRFSLKGSSIRRKMMKAARDPSFLARVLSPL